ncbi:hypothetical protein Fmac_030330 [Flemingia macrophylla]|uniref:Uncharacterized protein n=1 Tax=Flemingia macrophylla TaxID=520843 RepID=A0ABD1LD04_9FABA
MFNKILSFAKPKQENNAAVTDKLNKTLGMLEKKEELLLRKRSAEEEKAKTFIREKNKRGATQCLMRKKLYDQQIQQILNFQLRIHDQMIMLEGATVTADTIDALRTGAATMKAMQKETNIDDVDMTMTEINEQTENMRQIQEAISAPIELEGAELEKQLLQPATTAPVAPVQNPDRWQPTRRVSSKSTPEEDDELANLQAEMAF